MKIKNIKNKSIREAAIVNAEMHDIDCEIVRTKQEIMEQGVITSFRWNATLEGKHFWYNVHIGKIK